MSGAEIPYTQLSNDLLRAIIEEFVTREGTDYGHGNYNLDDKVKQVEKLLKSGQAVILFDEESETCTIIDKTQVNAKR